jgi:hypothetical protein
MDHDAVVRGGIAQRFQVVIRLTEETLLASLLAHDVQR